MTRRKTARCVHHWLVSSTARDGQFDASCQKCGGRCKYSARLVSTDYNGTFNQSYVSKTTARANASASTD